MAELRWCVAGRPYRHSITSDAKSVSIGRSAKSDVCIEDELMSLEHCELTRTSKGFEIRDCQSRSGVQVNGIAISMPVRLEDGDHIRLSENTEVRFMEKVVRGQSVAPSRAPSIRSRRASRRAQRPSDSSSSPI